MGFADSEQGDVGVGRGIVEICLQGRGSEVTLKNRGRLQMLGGKHLGRKD